jgi:hypothetical protein
MAVGAGLVVAAVAVVGQTAPEPRGSATVPSIDSPATVTFQPTAKPTFTPVRAGVQVIPRVPELELPAIAQQNGVYLSVIPDWLLNDPPSARFRVPVEVRGKTGLATTDRPASIAWTEDGFWYEMSSMRLGINELIRLASALE